MTLTCLLLRISYYARDSSMTTQIYLSI